MKLEQTKDEITAAIQEAQTARTAENDILEFASAHQTRISGGFDSRHMVSFVKGMAAIAGYEVRAELHDGKTLEIALYEENVGRWPEFGRRGVVRLTADHAKAVGDSTLIPMDFESAFVRDLAEVAGDRLEFDGLYAEAKCQAEEDVVAVYQVRWQGVSGELLEEELIVLSGRIANAEEMVHDDFATLLLSRLESRLPLDSTVSDKDIARNCMNELDALLLRRANPDRMPSSAFLAAGLRRRS